MTRKFFVLTLCIFLFALCVSVEAQQPEKAIRLGYLSSGAFGSSRIAGIRLALRERGYIEGQNLIVEARNGEGRAERYPEIAAEMVRLKVDIIVVAGGAPLVQAAKNATKTIPIVVFGPFDPIETGLIESLSRPGGNVTGMTNLGGELHGKRLELLKETVPKLTRVTVPYDPTIPAFVRSVKERLGAAARGLGVTIQPWEIRSAQDIDRLIAALGKQRPDGLLETGGALMRVHEKRLISFALTSRLPSMFDNTDAVDAGALMSYAANEAESNRRIAYFVDRILKGTKPADLPVEQPTKFEFAINLKTAKQIGLTIPSNVLARADRVIK